MRSPQRVRMSVTSRPAGSGQRSRLAGDSIWVMTYSARRRSSLFGDRRGVAGVEGRGAGQRVVPAVLPDVLEEQVEPPIRVFFIAVPAGLGRAWAR